MSYCLKKIYPRISILLTILFVSTITNATVINEIRIDQPGADTDEFFELAGTSGESLDQFSYLVIGDSGSNQGYIEALVNLAGYSIDSDGLFVVAESSFSLSPDVDLTTSLNFENNDNVTHMLVKNFSGHLHDDIDFNDDGVFDVQPWDNVVDSVALLDSNTGGDLIYSTTSIGPQVGHSPAHVYRQWDQTGSWQIGSAKVGIDDSPHEKHVAAVPEPTTLILLLTGLVLIISVHHRTGDRKKSLYLVGWAEG